ncbi:MAG: alpha/beta hydrolase, partial [Acetobacteraceae bacterium]|nr:alpha/beta hydrolase [Acetobacteraceae bacterium]
MSPRAGETRYLLAGAYYRMAFTEWGDPQAPALVCVHGLT